LGRKLDQHAIIFARLDGLTDDAQVIAHDQASLEQRPKREPARQFVGDSVTWHLKHYFTGLMGMASSMQSISSP
jgi:hypothetical protein